MEPDVRAFLLRIANTLAIVLLWMLINTVVGIKYNLAFFEDHVSWKNWLFYAWFITSFCLLIWHLRRKWKL